MDMNQKGSESEEISTSSPGQTDEPKKSCADCHTTRTPLWRGGPAGPRSLCNACGIRYRKKRKALLGLDKGGTEQSTSNKLGASSLKLGLMALGREMVWQKRKLGEEEQAAVLLMALSCGYV